MTRSQENITFPNPPIKEAILDLRVNLPEETGLEQLETYHDEIKGKFPKKEKRFIWEGKIEFKKEEIQPAIEAPPSRHDGFFFRSEDSSKVVQGRLDGFTFNKLRPYDNWEAFRSEGRDLWNHFVKIAKPKNVIRLALRYINRIEIPLPLEKFQDYILTFPQVASGIPNKFSNFLVRLEIPNPEIQAKAIVTETMEAAPPSGEFFPFIFDIDVIRTAVLDPADPEIWRIMEKLREFKNSIFLNSITEKTKGLFK